MREPRRTGTGVFVVRHISGLYARFVEGISSIRSLHEDRLVRSLERFYRGETRLIIAFRHVAKEDAPVLMHTVYSRLRRQVPGAEARVLYGQNVLNWAGAGARWIFPRLGCIPVLNTHMSRRSTELIRSALAEAGHPLMLAPEGQVTYHAFRVGALESGVAAMAHWARDAVQRGGDTREVEILPVSLAYGHDREPFELVRIVATKIANSTGRPLVLPSDRSEDSIRDCLLELSAQVLDTLESQYEQLWTLDSQATDLQQRFSGLAAAALAAGEQILGVATEGRMLDRLFQLRVKCIMRMYRSDVDPARLPPVQRALADTGAYEGAAAMRHQELADVCMYIDPGYIVTGHKPMGGPMSTSGPEPRAWHVRFAEYALNLLDLLNRAGGGTINSRFSPSRKTAWVYVGEPLRVQSEAGQLQEGHSLSAGGHKSDRREMLSAIHAAFTRDAALLERALS